MKYNKYISCCIWKGIDEFPCLIYTPFHNFSLLKRLASITYAQLHFFYIWASFFFFCASTFKIVECTCMLVQPHTLMCETALFVCICTVLWFHFIISVELQLICVQCFFAIFVEFHCFIKQIVHLQARRDVLLHLGWLHLLHYVLASDCI
jgi:hypothetical protein